MYVEDVEDGKRTYTHILAHNFLNTEWIFNPQKSNPMYIEDYYDLQRLRHK